MPGSSCPRAQLQSVSKEFPQWTRLDERGQTTREFARVLTILAAAILVGASGGIWIAGDNTVNLKLNKVVQAVARMLDRSDGREPVKVVPKTEMPPSTTMSEMPGVNPLPPQLQAQPAAHGLPSIENVHYSYQQGITTIDIDLGTSTLLQAARLHNPERIFFDLRNTQQAGGSVPREEQKVENIDDAVLSSLRVAPHGTGEVRIVLDVKQSCGFTYKQIAQPTARLLIELRHSSAGSPAPN